MPNVAPDWPGFVGMPPVKVRCEDEGGVTGEGLHRRAIIDSARFLQKPATKMPQPG